MRDRKLVPVASFAGRCRAAGGAYNWSGRAGKIP